MSISFRLYTTTSVPKNTHTQGLTDSCIIRGIQLYENLVHCTFRNHTTGSLNFFELLEELLFTLKRRVFENELCLNRVFFWVLSKRLLGLQIPTGQWNNNLQAKNGTQRRFVYCKLSDTHQKHLTFIY